MARKPAQQDEAIVVQEISQKTATFCVVGISPLIINRFQQKAWQELLFPAGRKSSAERQTTLKHDPYAEFRGALYRTRDQNSKALFHLPNGAFHGALAAAALDIPGAAKAKIERLTQVTDVNIALYGLPAIFCAMVRNSDINRTPDVRTRPIFNEWAAQVTISYVDRLLTQQTVANLFGGAGMIVGIGDWRPQKGGPFGRWRCCDPQDPEYKRITSKQGRMAQQQALNSPAFYDADTQELLLWFEQEVQRRERSDMLEGDKKTKKGKAKINGPTTKKYIEDSDGNLLNG